LSPDQSSVVKVLTGWSARCNEQFPTAAAGGALAYTLAQFVATTTKFAAQLKLKVTSSGVTKLEGAFYGATKLKASFGTTGFKTF